MEVNVFLNIREVHAKARIVNFIHKKIRRI